MTTLFRFDITHTHTRQLHHFCQVTLQLLTSVCMCDYSTIITTNTLHTHTSHTSTTTYTDSDGEQREEGGVGGW